MKSSDIDLSFAKTAGGDIGLIEGDDAVKHAISRLITTNLHDLAFNDVLRLNIRNYLFEEANQMVFGEIEQKIQHVLEYHEPRIKVKDVNVQILTGNGIDINIVYTDTVTGAVKTFDNSYGAK